jgi:uncharacterized membrane protein YoaK (UPF0700 family)
MMAIVLAALAGYLDGLGFLRLNGFFVSFMSENSTRMGVGLGGGDVGPALLAGAIIVVFLAGVIVGALVGRAAKAQCRLAILMLETLLLAAGGAQALGHNDVTMGAIIMATGVENSVYQRDGVVSTGLTYMTGALVKMGQRMAGALVGEAPFAWMSSFLLWSGFVTGAALGAAGYHWIGLRAIWGAALCAAGVTIVQAVKTIAEGEA